MSNESAETRAAGYYWVLDLNQGNHPVICEWCPHSDGHGYWWSIGSGAYDDSPCIERVLSGRLEPTSGAIDDRERWLDWMRKSYDYIEEILQWFEGCPLPSERKGKDLQCALYDIVPEPWVGEKEQAPEPPRVQRSEPGGYAEPTIKPSR